MTEQWKDSKSIDGQDQHPSDRQKENINRSVCKCYKSGQPTFSYRDGNEIIFCLV